MKPSKVLREAARIVERSRRPNYCGCPAIGAVLGIYFLDRDLPEPVMGYFRLVAPSPDSSPYGAWWRGPEEKGERIIGLCLAAAIAESEGK